MSVMGCGKHGLAALCLVCRHLVDGESTEWLPVPSPNQEMYDWLCPECVRAGRACLTPTDLVVSCVHCVRDLQAQATRVCEVDAEHLEYLCERGFVQRNPDERGVGTP
jgi:hypothetical protein